LEIALNPNSLPMSPCAAPKTQLLRATFPDPTMSG